MSSQHIFEAQSASSAGDSQAWQSKLEDACREYQLALPSFQMVADSRGCRTAWSSRVTVNGAIHQARFWYDGKNLNNAKEDAAEVALRFVSMAASLSAPRGWQNASCTTPAILRSPFCPDAQGFCARPTEVARHGPRRRSYRDSYTGSMHKRANEYKC
ncbi:hypothetical protein F5883DRAFT_587044 [Diaporthe sp. PMI_573]|nr:hypothetical protein F5883DRAFT_587044 [Diaporthaceae sp. PMI_573]